LIIENQFYFRTNAMAELKANTGMAMGAALSAAAPPAAPNAVNMNPIIVFCVTVLLRSMRLIPAHIPKLAPVSVAPITRRDIYIIKISDTAKYKNHL
jgi:hypothetical protein